MERERRSQYPIRSWFTVETTPEGEAPEDIREQWVGVTLPVREELPAPDTGGVGVLTGERVGMERPIPVDVDDAIVALRGAGKALAARWWKDNWADFDWGTRTPVLLFEAEWGKQEAV